MIKCMQCGAQNRDGARFCTICGSSLPAAQPGGGGLTRLPTRSSGGALMPRLPAPQPPAMQPSVLQTPVPTPYQGRPAPLGPVPAGFPNAWPAPRPLVEGRVSNVDAPVQEKGSIAGKLMAAGCLALIMPILAFLPFVRGAQVTVRYLRVEDYQTGQQRSVKMRGEAPGAINTGDWVAVWGRNEGGNVIMSAAYNYTTGAALTLRV